MIRSYRQRGHLIAKLDPLGLLKSDYLDELHPESYGFKKEDLALFVLIDFPLQILYAIVAGRLAANGKPLSLVRGIVETAVL